MLIPFFSIDPDYCLLFDPTIPSMKMRRMLLISDNISLNTESYFSYE